MDNCPSWISGRRNKSMWPERVSNPDSGATDCAMRPGLWWGKEIWISDCQNWCYYQLWDGEGWEYAQQTAKNTFDTKSYISSRKHAHDQLMIRGNHVQIQPIPSPLHCDLEHIHRIPSTKSVCVCVCVCVLCVCVCARARASVCVCGVWYLFYKMYFAR